MIHEPLIETCRLGIEDNMCNVFNSTFVGDTTSCSDTRDTFVNIHPMELFFAFDLSFHLPQDPPKDPDKHKFVEDFHFGIVDGDVTLYLYQKSTNGGKLKFKQFLISWFTQIWAEMLQLAIQKNKWKTKRAIFFMVGLVDQIAFHIVIMVILAMFHGC